MNFSRFAYRYGHWFSTNGHTKYYLSPFILFLVRNPATPNPTTPNTHKHKKHGPAECAFAEMKSTNLQAPRPQLDTHTLLGQPEHTGRTIFGPQLCDLFILGPLSSGSKIFWILGTPNNVPKSHQKIDFGTFVGPMLIICWTPLASIFCIFLESPKTHVLQHV